MNEPYHHGIQGQKWGRRRWQNEDGTYNEAGKARYFGSTRNEKSSQTKYNNAKAAYKDAKKQYNRDFNKAYNKGLSAYSPFKKHRQANDERWNTAAESAKKLNDAKASMKSAKKKLNDKKKEYKEEQRRNRQLEEGKELSKRGASKSAIDVFTTGSIAMNHMGNKYLKDIVSDALDSKATTWISKSGKTEIPVSAIARNVLTAGELFTDAYIVGKAHHNKKALDAYENRNKKK
jgi:hypothetical protein